MSLDALWFPSENVLLERLGVNISWPGKGQKRSNTNFFHSSEFHGQGRNRKKVAALLVRAVPVEEWEKLVFDLFCYLQTCLLLQGTHASANLLCNRGCVMQGAITCNQNIIQFEQRQSIRCWGNPGRDCIHYL